MSMTPAEFRQRLKALDMTQREFAERAGRKYRTVSDWGKPRGGQSFAFPGWVNQTLSVLESEAELLARLAAKNQTNARLISAARVFAAAANEAGDDE